MVKQPHAVGYCIYVHTLNWIRVSDCLLGVSVLFVHACMYLAWNLGSDRHDACQSPITVMHTCIRTYKKKYVFHVRKLWLLFRLGMLMLEPPCFWQLQLLIDIPAGGTSGPRTRTFLKFTADWKVCLGTYVHLQG